MAESVVRGHVLFKQSIYIDPKARTKDLVKKYTPQPMLIQQDTRHYIYIYIYMYIYTHIYIYIYSVSCLVGPCKIYMSVPWYGGPGACSHRKILKSRVTQSHTNCWSQLCKKAK